ncbi:unnamed protein product [Acanthoscelides obtectus]|uniref:Uncharacterized protein n=1 Tax=Acanthoscelides obtectus TaxID=200917 RepID=A0A9P0LMD2_ACAOB|nr:unnamed protein product [Acanthoscelides obtectus]CAK1620087.1 hypothetical protein AOBTE_LOCUS189 [Acanthoscelides obtectus]
MASAPGSDTASVKSTPRVKTPDGRKVGFARPSLIIPPPQAQRTYGPHSAHTAHMTGVPLTAASIGPQHGMYGRKASMFVFDQIHGLKDFTMATAKSGLGIGEKCSYWVYNKISAWSRKWFTHFFLSIVLVLYTICGALTFIYIEGKFKIAS